MELSDFNYQIKGDHGPWLVFLHGLMGSSQNWRRITPSFEVEYRCLVYDQRGHGRSFKPETGYAPEDYAKDLKFLFDKLHISKAVVIGHSMGGRNALAFAHLFPEHLTALVIEDIGPQATANTGSQVVEKLKNVPREFPTRLEAKRFLMNEFGDPRLGMFMYTNIVTDADGKSVWAFNLETMMETITKGRANSRWEYLETLTIPTFVIRGENSDELPRPEFARMLKSNPLISGIEIAGAGHWVHADKANEFIAALKKFLPVRLANQP